MVPDEDVAELGRAFRLITTALHHPLEEIEPSEGRRRCRSNQTIRHAAPYSVCNQMA